MRHRHAFQLRDGAGVDQHFDPRTVISELYVLHEVFLKILEVRDVVICFIHS